MSYLMTDAVFALCERGNCSPLELLNENVDIFFVMVNYYFERLSYEDENNTDGAGDVSAPTTENKFDFWDF